LGGGGVGGETATEITNLKNIIITAFYQTSPFILLDNLKFSSSKIAILNFEACHHRCVVINYSYGDYRQ
jgi:hypothetical protein